MSDSPTQPTGRSLANLRPWVKGQSGNPGGWSPERRELVAALESKQVPRVMEVLDKLYADYMEDGDPQKAKLFLEQVRGHIKPMSSDQLEAAIDARLVELAAEARARRANGG